jgi:RNA polymerase sigma-70 factor (ECF subfamily)
VEPVLGEEVRVRDVDAERRRCFEALFNENIADIDAYCQGRAGSPSDAQDAAGEVFLIAWRRLDEVPRGRDARPWLYATARRVMANRARANARRRRLYEKLGAQPIAASPGDDEPLAARVADALSTLRPRDREVLLLAGWEGLTAAEIAVVVHRPAVTVRGRLHRARRRFRAAFEASQAPSADRAPAPADAPRLEPLQARPAAGPATSTSSLRKELHHASGHQPAGAARHQSA